MRKIYNGLILVSSFIVEILLPLLIGITLVLGGISKQNDGFVSVGIVIIILYALEIIVIGIIQDPELQ